MWLHQSDPQARGQRGSDMIERMFLGLGLAGVLFGVPACGGGSGGNRNVPQNQPPALATIATPQSVFQGSVIVFQISATDPDSDPITFSMVPHVANSWLVDNLNGTADFSFSPDFTQGGGFFFTFRASDPFNPPDTQVVEIRVTGRGSGTFTEVLPAASIGVSAWGIDSADLDGNGSPDLAATDMGMGGVGAGLVILLNDGAGNLAATIESPYSLPLAGPDPGPSDVAIADFDGDGVLDVAIVAQLEGDLHVFLGDGPGGLPDGTFTYHPAGFMDFPVQDAFHVTAGDLRGDGNADLLIGPASGSGNLYVLLGDGTGSFNLSSQSPFDTSTSGGGGIVFTAIGDVNADGILDIAAANSLDSIIRFYLGDDDGAGRNGMGTFVLGPGSIPTPVSLPGLPSLADYDGDGRLDLAVPHFDAPAVFTVWRGDGSGLFQEAPPPRAQIGQSSQYSATGEFDGDGVPDLVASAVGTEDLHVILGTGNGTFGAAPGGPYPLGGDPRYIAVNDFDGDGIADIAVAVRSPAEVHLFLGN